MKKLYGEGTEASPVATCFVFSSDPAKIDSNPDQYFREMYAELPWIEAAFDEWDDRLSSVQIEIGSVRESILVLIDSLQTVRLTQHERYEVTQCLQQARQDLVQLRLVHDEILIYRRDVVLPILRAGALAFGLRSV